MTVDPLDSPARILILALRSIGDIVLITPVFRAIKDTFPSARLSVLVEKHTAPVLAHHPCLDQVIEISRSSGESWWHPSRYRKLRDLVRRFRSQEFDMAIDLFSGPTSALLGYLSQAKHRYGEDVRSRGRGWLYNHPVVVQRDGKHLTEQKFEIVKSLARVDHIRDYPLEVFLAEDEKQFASDLMAKHFPGEQVRIGLVPGAGSRWRRWPPERFAQLGYELNKRFNAQIVVLGGQEDQVIAKNICERMGVAGINLCGTTSLRESIAVMAELDIIISNVTGPMHLASALEKPYVVGLYGVADTIQYALWGKQGFMLTKGSLSEAYWKNVDYQKDYQVLLQIGVKDVLDAIQRVKGA